MHEAELGQHLVAVMPEACKAKMEARAAHVRNMAATRRKLSGGTPQQPQL
jgi:hypothetical protein